MAYIVRMPKLGLEMSQGTLLTWTVEEGDAVEEGDVIATVESEKTQADVEAREAGVLRRRDLSEGETCAPGDPIGIVAEPEADVSGLEATIADERGEAAPAAGEDERTAVTEERSVATEERSTSAEERGTPSGSGSGGGAVKASPPARRRAEELGVDLASVEGTGPGGAVTPDDVERADAGGEETGEGGVEPTLVEERPLTGTRRTIAERLGESYRNAVHVTERRTVDAEALVSVADAADEALDADVAVTDVVLLAVSATLDEHPAFNARFEDDVHRLYAEHNLCIAVDTEQGLLAPVVRDVGSRSLDAVATERHAVTGRVLSDDHTMDDLAGGTFTITNLGPFGVESFDPIINPPQVAILGINAIDEAVVPSADGGVEVRKRLPLNVSFDHRVVDGADAARFLATLADHLESPRGLVGAEIEDG